MNVFGLGVLVDECHLCRLCSMENGEGRTDGVNDTGKTSTFSPKSIAREEREGGAHGACQSQSDSAFLSTANGSTRGGAWKLLMGCFVLCLFTEMDFICLEATLLFVGVLMRAGTTADIVTGLRNEVGVSPQVSGR